jgi:hypothetical protein
MPTKKKNPQQGPRPKAKGRRSHSYGDENFKGYGIIKCNICGEPLAEHVHIGPCPLAGPNAKFTTPRNPRQRPQGRD